MLTGPIGNEAAMKTFSDLDLRAVALLFDIDGTLIDIGPSPFEVVVSDTLKESLRQLYELTDGATGLVSGRPIGDIDLIFSPLQMPAIGGHGAEMRVVAGPPIARIPPLPEKLRRNLVAAATPGSGVQFEDKGYSVALHYRTAPRQAERLRHHIAESRAAFPDERTELLLGKAMFEVKRPGVDKGEAVRELMREPPFAGRTPVFIGDDVTDEAVFEILPALGGKGFAVGRHFPNVTGIFTSPAEVRQALQRLVRNATATS
ncbi:MAG TPA: trehalose-phosphatase [Pseudolabrys sp.]|nr:trehalose-phosphatase [Pseudolabrys sp.]